MSIDHEPCFHPSHFQALPVLNITTGGRCQGAGCPGELTIVVLGWLCWSWAFYIHSGHNHKGKA